MTAAIVGQSRIHVVIVEDDPNVGQSVKDAVEKQWPGTIVDVKDDFKDAEAYLGEHSPDVVVLDIYRGSPIGDDQAGAEVLGRLWNVAFAPVVVYTAGNAEDIHGLHAEHPFVKYVKKGADSVPLVIAEITSFLPHVGAVREVRSEITKATQIVLRHVSGTIWDATQDEETRKSLLLRSTRRRLAAMMDLETVVYQRLAYCWEQYIIPTLEADPLAGDVLRSVGGDANDPAAHRIILTPSCDMVKEGQEPKCRSALVAKCKPITDYVKAVGMEPGTKPRKIEDKLKTVLRLPQYGGHVPLPPYHGVLPLMAANLRDLELVPLSEIGKPGEKGVRFERVASVDSPFREFIIWGYLQVAGRPGLPERDIPQWIDSIVASITQNEPDSGTGE